VVSLLSAVFAPFEKTHGFHFTFTVIFALFITVAFATVFAFFVQTYAQRFTTPTKTAVIFALEPVCAAFLGVFFGETLLIRQIIGGALVIVSMILAEI
jgi:drug/metabolite transporter (DMT)-like permease